MPSTNNVRFSIEEVIKQIDTIVLGKSLIIQLSVVLIVISSINSHLSIIMFCWQNDKRYIVAKLNHISLKFLYSQLNKQNNIKINQLKNTSINKNCHTWQVGLGSLNAELKFANFWSRYHTYIFYMKKPLNQFSWNSCLIGT